MTDFAVDHDFERLGYRAMLLNGWLLLRGAAPPRLLLAIEDVTARKRSRQALEESEARFRGILDSAADGIITIDECGAADGEP